MAEIKKLVKRRNSAKNLKKITKTMSLIAAAKFKVTSKRIATAKPYTQKLSEMVAELVLSGGNLDHPLIQKHESQQKVAVVVITSNRGFCGAYNANILKKAMQTLEELVKEGRQVTLHVLGKKGIQYFSAQRDAKWELQTYPEWGDNPKYQQINELAQKFVTQYMEKKINQWRIVYMDFQSASRQKPQAETLLPFPADKFVAAKQSTDYLIYPDTNTIIDYVVPQCIFANVYRIFLEASTSEHVQRMVAMKMATDNATDMIKNLTQLYNRARQAAITKEISEIMGAVRALKKG